MSPAKKKLAPKKAKKLPSKLPLPPLVPRPNGRGALYVGGVPGHDGSKAGRPPKAFKEFCATVAQDPTFQEKLGETAKDPDHRHYPAAVKMVAEYGEGLPAQPIDITVSINTVRERIAGRLARIAHARRTG